MGSYVELLMNWRLDVAGFVAGAQREIQGGAKLLLLPRQEL